MAKQFRQYELGEETIVVEEVGRFRIKWYKFLDKFDPVMNWIDPPLRKWGIFIAFVCYCFLILATYFDVPYINIPLAILMGLAFTYSIGMMVVDLRKKFKKKP